MPRSAPSPCRVPGCALLANDKTLQGYCVEHRGELQKKRRKYQTTSRQRRNENAEQLLLDAFYRSGAWRRCRDAYIKKSPLCEHCSERGVVKSADVVDHIIERRDGGANYEHNNLQSLCHGCHNEKTINERRRRDGN